MTFVAKYLEYLHFIAQCPYLVSPRPLFGYGHQAHETSYRVEKEPTKEGVSGLLGRVTDQARVRKFQKASTEFGPIHEV